MKCRCQRGLLFSQRATSAVLCVGVIVQDEVHIKIGSHLALNLTQKAHKFLASMARFGDSNDPTGCYIQSGKERSGAVPIVVRLQRGGRPGRIGSMG